MSPRYALAIALCSLVVVDATASRAQNLVGLPTASTARDLAAASQEVDRLAEESSRIDTESSTLGPRRDELRARARQQTRWLYHLTQGAALVLQGGPEMLLDHAARSERVRQLLHRTLLQLDEAGRRADALEADRTRVAALLAAAQTHKGELVAAQRAAHSMMGSPAYGATAQTNGPSVTVYGGAPTAVEATGFAESSGRLLFPVLGRAEVRRMWREGADGPGLEVRCGIGTVVRAVFPGRVAFADRYGSYGQIVIVDHGDHYYTVSANLGQVSVRVGEELAQGSPVGVAGNDGHGPMMFFEVRHGSETLDPAPWLGL